MAKVDREDQTKERQNALAVRAPNDPAAMEELVRITAPIAISLVQKIDLRSYGSDAFSELYQEAMLGIVEAAHEFDPTYGVKFWTFAYYRIRKNLSQWMAQNSGAVAIPYEAWRTAKMVDELEYDAGKSLSEKELAGLTGKGYARNAADARASSLDIDQLYGLSADDIDFDDVVLEFLHGLSALPTVGERFQAAVQFCALHDLNEFTAARMVVVAEEL